MADQIHARVLTAQLLEQDGVLVEFILAKVRAQRVVEPTYQRFVLTTAQVDDRVHVVPRQVSLNEQVNIVKLHRRRFVDGIDYRHSSNTYLEVAT